jgi:hypothetical protein
VTVIGLLALTATPARADPQATRAANPQLTAPDRTADAAGAPGKANAAGKVVTARSRNVVPGAAGIIVPSPNGRLFATASHGTVGQWSTTTGRRAAPAIAAHAGAVHALAYSPDGKMLAVAGEQALSLWDAATGQPAGPPLAGPVGPVRSVAFSADGQLVAAAGDDGTIRLWNPSGRELVRALTGHAGAVRASRPSAPTTPCGCGRPAPAHRSARRCRQTPAR